MKNLLTSIQVKQKVGVAALAFACTLAGTQVNAATFPNSPLITGGQGIPPNILLILDDSGSMAWQTMPANEPSSLGDNPTWRSYVNNTIYYKPESTYKPWRTASVDLSDRMQPAVISALSSSDTTVSSRNFDLRDKDAGIFYVPKIGVTNPGTNVANYEKFRVARSSSANSVNDAVVQKKVATFSEVVETFQIPSLATNATTNCFVYDARNWESIKIQTSGNNGDADLYVWLKGNCNGGNDGKSDGNSSNESWSKVAPNSRVSFIIKAYGQALTNLTVTISRENSWNDETPVFKNKVGTLVQRSQAEELQNIANWYEYSRTRSKTAKAGASEAFGQLGTRYRVGFDTIWNRRNGNSVNTSGSAPAYAIPYAQDDALFTDNSRESSGNRSTFFSMLQSATANNGTPLHGALDRAGRYFKDDDGPWRDTANSSLKSCRQNYAILTTDGFWNDNDGYSSNVGNADSGSRYTDSKRNTLADVAYYYWKNDLRGTMDDNVRPTTDDPATWQHMVTFGISIGQKGTLDTSTIPPANWDAVSPWTRGDQVYADNSEVIPQRIDDLWHAALNGHGKFVVAGNSDEFADALKSALDTIAERTASGSNIASSSTKTDAGTFTFAAKFTSGSWIGDLSASPFNAALTGVSTTPVWRLSETFGAGGANENFASRYVLTTWNGSPVRFDTSYAGVSQFERLGGTDAVSGGDNISYILGDQRKEIGKPNGVLRSRAYPMGDIVDSSPSYNSDTQTVFIGANDGMLHAIDASSNNTKGKVLFSYIPTGLNIADLKTLSSVEYDHRYFMDGQIDTITRAKQGYSKNILLGAPGRGAKGVFALDVTNPSVNSTALFLWDKTNNVDNDMGYVLGNVRLRQSNKKDALGKQKIFAIVPNGIDSTNGKAVIFIYELSNTGAVDTTYKLSTDNATNNGMMSTGLADLDGNGTIDTIYGGDLLGRVWKWDVSTIPVNGGPTLTGTKLFTATDGTNAQPITGGIGVARDSNGQIFVGFGTGRLISLSDLPGNSGYVNQTQSLYGIKDLNTTVARADLEARSIPFTGTMNNLPVRGFQSYQDLPSAKKGWYINLGVPAATAAGERVITSPTMVGSAMWITSVIPAQGSDCSGALGSGYLNVLNIFTGTSPLQNSYFDTNGTIAGPNNTTGLVGSMGIVGGMPTEVNVTSQLATVGDGGGGSPVSFKRTLPLGGIPQRMTWREVVAPDN